MQLRTSEVVFAVRLQFEAIHNKRSKQRRQVLFVDDVLVHSNHNFARLLQDKDSFTPHENNNEGEREGVGRGEG